MKRKLFTSMLCFCLIASNVCSVSYAAPIPSAETAEVLTTDNTDDSSADAVDSSLPVESDVQSGDNDLPIETVQTEAPAPTETVQDTETPATETTAPETETETESETETETETEAPALKDGLYTEDDKIYYYENGKLFTDGYKEVVIDGQTYMYYFQKNGEAFTKGLLEMNDGKTSYYYYFQSNGQAFNGGYKSTSTYTVIDENGYLVDKSDGVKHHYYFQKNGSAFMDGTLEFTNTHGTYIFYFQKNGQGFTGGYKSTKTYSVADINGNITNKADKKTRYYYFQKNGRAFTQGLLEFTNDKGTFYFYFQKNGQGFNDGYKSTKTYFLADKKGKITDKSDGKLRHYYFQKNGQAYKKGLLTFTNTHGTYTFYFQKNGQGFTGGYKPTATYAIADKNGKITNKADDTTRYFYFQKNGRAYTKGLLEFTNDKGTFYFYFQKDGIAYTTGYLSTSTYAVADKKGKLTDKADGTKRYYYFQKNGQAYTKGLLKFKHTNGKTYHFYFQKNGQGYTKGWLTVNGKKYYFGSNGQAYTGLKTINNKRYFFNKSNAVLEWTNRKYQNPSGYYQIHDSNIKLSGGNYELNVGYEGLRVAWVIRALGLGNGIGMGGAYYSQNVKNAVIKFQKSHGLTANGITGLKTWKAMGYTESQWNKLGAYASPLAIDIYSTRSDCIEAMINRAYDYLGDDYIIGASGAPGYGVDCSGLVMQALFAAGIDMSPINPVRHASPGYEYESQNIWTSSKLKHVSYGDRERGDIIIYCNSSGTVIHSAIYLGNNKVIESWPNTVQVSSIKDSRHPYVKGVLRVFN